MWMLYLKTLSSGPISAVRARDRKFRMNSNLKTLSVRKCISGHFHELTLQCLDQEGPMIPSVWPCKNQVLSLENMSQVTKEKANGVKSCRKMACFLVSSSWDVSQLKEGKEKQRLTNVCAAHSCAVILVQENQLTAACLMAERAGKRLPETCDSIVRLGYQKYPRVIQILREQRK